MGSIEMHEEIRNTCDEPRDHIIYIYIIGAGRIVMAASMGRVKRNHAPTRERVAA